jgi:nucleoside 2-deoxyribosyltransferase
MSKIKCYIAGPFFKEGERERLEKLRQFFENDDFFDDYEFFFPMDHKIPGGEEMSNGEWAWNVFEMDTKELASSDLVIAVYDKHYSDSGFQLGKVEGDAPASTTKGEKNGKESSRKNQASN